MLLVASFAPSCINIAPFFEDDEIVLNYADPKFTDDTLSDILRKWEVGGI